MKIKDAQLRNRVHAANAVRAAKAASKEACKPSDLMAARMKTVSVNGGVVSEGGYPEHEGPVANHHAADEKSEKVENAAKVDSALSPVATTPTIKDDTKKMDKPRKTAKPRQ